MKDLLRWGSNPQLVFETEDEFYRTLGQVTNENAFAISFEANKKTCSYSDAYRLRVRGNDYEFLTNALKNKLRTGGRINCNEYVEYLISHHNFLRSGNIIKRNFENVIATIPEQYVSSFLQGFKEASATGVSYGTYTTESIYTKEAVLEKKTIPISPKSKTISKKQGKRDYIQKAIDNFEIGEAGEEIVYQYEVKKLQKACAEGVIKSWEDKIEWVSRRDDSAGYDIRSYDAETGKDIYIEVKTTTANAATPFYISENELRCSAEFNEQYLLYRLYNLDRRKPEIVPFYVLQGDINMHPNVEIIKGQSIVKIKSDTD